MSQSAVEVLVTDVPEATRYEARVGDELAGFAVYARYGSRTVFLHTEVDPAFEGQGVGSVLARGALDAVRDAGGEVVPLCPFIRGWIERHPDYADLVVPVRISDIPTA
ncbi:GNAT family N-acetyltransferase [Conexibacter sp. SYSU D00693]|uniref:GNAT family N-acetyltransferase n=1 Tax=Conexibacter sp. SYSU D00693 TaxID=2812560 RepID=UPI00196AC35B|nr:GNAT family N-acetyltransferase [Conexibacter sp. SYSU D00693]